MPGRNGRRIALYFVLVVVFALCLYLPFLSQQWDLNGLTEAHSVDRGGADMFSPNHLLYRPLTFVLFRVAQLGGYTGNSAAILQPVSALCGALGIGFLFLGFYYLTRRPMTAVLGSALIATSWSYWKFSVDIAYIIPAAMIVGIAFALLLRPSHSRWTVAALGVIAAVAVLLYQANIFVVPLFAVRLLYCPESEKFRDRLAKALLLITVSGLVVASAYVLVPGIVLGHETLAETLQWGTSYSAELTATKAPMWGKWDISRFKPAAQSAIASIVPVWKGLGIRELLAGKIDPAKVLPQLSLLAVSILAALSIALLFAGRPDRRISTGHLSLAVLSYLAHLGFIVWWDPFEPKWFVIPNILLVAGLLSLWKDKANSRLSRIIMGGCIAVIASANFSSTIWPEHNRLNPDLQIAKCFAESTTQYDTFVLTDWTWFGYTDHFCDYNGEALRLKPGEHQRQRNIELIETELREKQERQQGNIYVTDLQSYSQQALRYWENEAGMLSVEALRQFHQEPAFKCNNLQFMRIQPETVQARSQQ